MGSRCATRGGHSHAAAKEYKLQVESESRQELRPKIDPRITLEDYIKTRWLELVKKTVGDGTMAGTYLTTGNGGPATP